VPRCHRSVVSDPRKVGQPRVAGTPSTGPERLTAKPARLRLPRGRKRTLPIDQTEGVVALVQQIDPLQNGFDRRAFSL
jgi:hypothetical protein